MLHYVSFGIRWVRSVQNGKVLALEEPERNGSGTRNGNYSGTRNGNGSVPGARMVQYQEPEWSGTQVYICSKSALV